MKLSSILIIRGRETVLDQNRPQMSGNAVPAFEILGIDLPGGRCRSTAEVVPSDPGTFFDAVKTELYPVLDQVKPKAALVFTESAGLGKKLTGMIHGKNPGIQVYTQGSPCPLVGFQVCPWKFNTGDELAGYLKKQMDKSMPGGIEFLWTSDPGDNGRSVEPDSEQGIQDFLDILSQWMAQKPDHLNFSLQIPGRSGADVSTLESRLPFLIEKGLSMVHWQLSGSKGGLPRDLLWKLSKLGVWNHVSGRDLFRSGQGREDGVSDLGRWIANSPDIVHSFTNISHDPRTSMVTPPRAVLSYGKLPSLPDIPLWHLIRDPGLILGFLRWVSKKELLKMRADTDKGTIAGLGKNVEYHFKKPEELSREILDEIVAMVDAGGSVDITHVRANLENAYLIGYAMENGVIAGNSSLKHPRQVFIDRLQDVTGLDFSHCVERGYTSVRPEYRAMGIGAKLLEGLTARAKDVKVFSIISEDNPATQKIAIRNNTRKIAVYFSDKLGKKMGIWMPEFMIKGKLALKYWDQGQRGKNQMDKEQGGRSPSDQDK